MTALMALLLPLALTSCTATDDATPQLLPGNPNIPGTASPEGGDQPGVSIQLTQPRITISGINAEAKAGTRAKINSNNIDNIELYVDLLDENENVKQSSYYEYFTNDWIFSGSSTPLKVHGGTGLYFMRAVASVTTNDKGTFQVCYSGTAGVAEDGTFTFSKSLKPYASSVTVILKGADGKELVDPNDYAIVLRGIAGVQRNFNSISGCVAWTTGSTSRPEYSANDHYYTSDGSNTFHDILPGNVPATWYQGADSYGPASIEGDDSSLLGSDEILFSIYKNAKGLDSTTGIPSSASAKYHVKIAANKKYTLEAGKSYTFTLKLNADKTFHIEKFDDITVGDFGEGGNIEIGK